MIATHKRIDALRCTLQSVVLQRHHDWTALVIGDQCGPETGTMIRALGDPRIRYYNLPVRCGEQSGPNSFGLSLASGSYVSFLNHDDLLLRDHLTHGIERIASTGSDFFIGKFANATELRDDDDGRVAPVFTGTLPRTEDLTTMMIPEPWQFEPSSLWLVRTPYAKEVGSWKSARSIWRTPLRDWLLRAWRKGGKFCFGERITGARFWTQNLRQPPLYSHATAEHEYMVERIHVEGSTTLGRAIEEEIAAFRESRGKRLKKSGGSEGKLWSASKRRRSARLYLAAGIDLYNIECRLRGDPKGGLLRSLTEKRTGESLDASRGMRHISNPEDYREI